MVICHGGPIAEPDDAAYIIHKIPEIDGFFGASSIERFAAERGIKAQARRVQGNHQVSNAAYREKGFSLGA